MEPLRQTPADPFAPFEWRLANGRSLTLGPQAQLIGILNVTPDSFSDGGAHLNREDAMRQADRMIAEGAAIIDIGGESTRPGAPPLSAGEEQGRVLPIIEWLAADRDALISVDTWRAETARLALRAGAHIVNDIWGLQKDGEIAAEIARSGAGAILMHNGRERERNRDVLADQSTYLARSLSLAREAGIRDHAVVLDPGFGFAKDPDENLELIFFFDALHQFGRPLVVGASRKRFIGHVTGGEAPMRDLGTAAANVIARMKGAALFRVHNVAVNREALAMADAVLDAGRALESRPGR
jgi:dihydropteroate synthase